MKKTLKLAYIAIFAAINYVTFTFAKIDIPLAASSHVAIHVANAVVVVSGLLLGPIEGGLSGAIGLSIADVLDPRYITSAPKTFILKFCIGYIAGKIGQKTNLNKLEDKKLISKNVFIAAFFSLGFNVIFDPIFGYLYKRYLLGVEASAANIILTWTAGVTAFNALICLFVSVILYLATYKIFRNHSS